VALGCCTVVMPAAALLLGSCRLHCTIPSCHDRSTCGPTSNARVSIACTTCMRSVCAPCIAVAFVQMYWKDKAGFARRRACNYVGAEKLDKGDMDNASWK
jgi:hypothetical protein